MRKYTELSKYNNKVFEQYLYNNEIIDEGVISFIKKTLIKIFAALGLVGKKVFNYLWHSDNSRFDRNFSYPQYYSTVKPHTIKHYEEYVDKNEYNSKYIKEFTEDNKNWSSMLNDTTFKAIKADIKSNPIYNNCVNLKKLFSNAILNKVNDKHYIYNTKTKKNYSIYVYGLAQPKSEDDAMKGIDSKSNDDNVNIDLDKNDATTKKYGNFAANIAYFCVESETSTAIFIDIPFANKEATIDNIKKDVVKKIIKDHLGNDSKKIANFKIGNLACNQKKPDKDLIQWFNNITNNAYGQKANSDTTSNDDETNNKTDKYAEFDKEVKPEKDMQSGSGGDIDQESDEPQTNDEQQNSDKQESDEPQNTDEPKVDKSKKNKKHKKSDETSQSENLDFATIEHRKLKKNSIGYVELLPNNEFKFNLNNYKKYVETYNKKPTGIELGKYFRLNNDAFTSTKFEQMLKSNNISQTPGKLTDDGNIQKCNIMFNSNQNEHIITHKSLSSFIYEALDNDNIFYLLNSYFRNDEQSKNDFYNIIAECVKRKAVSKNELAELIKGTFLENELEGFINFVDNDVSLKNTDNNIDYLSELQNLIKWLITNQSLQKKIFFKHN